MTAEPRAASGGARAAPTSNCGGGRHSQCGRQGQTYGEQPNVVPEVFSQLRESYAAGICEQHPNKRDLRNDLRCMGIRVDLHKLEAFAQDEPDGHEEDRR